MDDKTKLVFQECASRLFPENAELKLAIQNGDKDGMYKALKQHPTKTMWEFFYLADEIGNELSETVN